MKRVYLLDLYEVQREGRQPHGLAIHGEKPLGVQDAFHGDIDV
jgi:hypothetical protein